MPWYQLRLIIVKSKTGFVNELKPCTHSIYYLEISFKESDCSKQFQFEFQWCNKNKTNYYGEYLLESVTRIKPLYFIKQFVLQSFLVENKTEKLCTLPLEMVIFQTEEDERLNCRVKMPLLYA